MRLIALLLALATTACDAQLPQAFAGSISGSSVKAEGRAIDGDTVSIDLRLFGADALERKQWCARRNTCWPCGKAAQDFASKQLKGATATIQFTGEQSYGRPVSIVSVKGRDLGETMIAAGYAVPTPSFLKKDPQRASRYNAALNAAAASRIGLHGGDFVEPSQWRKGTRVECERRRERD